MSMSKTVAENQIKLYNLGEQEGYRKALQVHNGGKVISDYDLIPLTSRDPIEQAYPVTKVYYKDFTFDENTVPPYNVCFEMTGALENRTAIVVSGAAITDSEGIKLTYVEDKQVVTDYNYTNGGNEEFVEGNATFGRISSNAVVSINGAMSGKVCKNFCGSDDMYISGAKVRTDRVPVRGRLAWSEVPEETKGCDYIIFPGSAISATKKVISFNVSGSVRVYVLSASVLTFNEAWFQLNGATAKSRYQNNIDRVTMAYAVFKGYAAVSDVLLENNNCSCRRWDALYKVVDDCGTKYGYRINPKRLAKTGFTETVTDFKYTDYLNAWVPYPCDGEYVVNTIIGTANDELEAILAGGVD